ncbi:MAG: hypothetical protein FWD58_02150 [Firmicutes bacterium]|nr:hypothetical protein [Bacillota bacterium]
MDDEKINAKNAMHDAMKNLQDDVRGAAVEVGLEHDEDVVDLVMESRYGEKKKTT